MPKTKRQIQEAAKEAVNQLVETTILEQEEESAERIPGRVIKGTKTPWTRKDVDNAFPLCTFTPDETLPVTYNGVRYQLISGLEMLAPSIIRDIYLDSRKRRMEAAKNMRMLGVTVDPGVGALT